MIYNKTTNDRRNWFISRIGKRVFRNDVSCQCKTCQNITKLGLVINDEMDAEDLYYHETDLSIEGVKIRYFDYKEEVNEFMKNG